MTRFTHLAVGYIGAAPVHGMSGCRVIVMRIEICLVTAVAGAALSARRIIMGKTCQRAGADDVTAVTIRVWLAAANKR